MPKQYLLKEISSIADVSLSTASRFLANPESVKESTRKKIELALRAQKIRISKRKSNIIAFIAPDLNNQFFQLLLQGIESIAKSHGQMIVICDSQGSTEQENQIVSNLLTMNIDGILCICSSDYAYALEHIVKEKTVPIVFLDRKPMIKGINTVTTDGVNGMYQGTKFLLALGHTKIMYLGGVKDTSTENDRYKGFKSAYSDSNIDFDESNKFYGNYDKDLAYSITKGLINEGKFPYTAIACTNDLMAIGAYMALKENNISIPEEVSILGFDDIPSANLISLTTIKQPFKEIGSMAMLRLLELIEDPFKPAKETVLDSSIIMRNSCRYPKEH